MLDRDSCNLVQAYIVTVNSWCPLRENEKQVFSQERGFSRLYALNNMVASTVQILLFLAIDTS